MDKMVIREECARELACQKEINYKFLDGKEDEIIDYLFNSIKDSIFSKETIDIINSKIELLKERNGVEYQRVIEYIHTFFTQVPSFQTGELGEVVCKELFIKLEGKTIYILKDWGIRDNPTFAKRGFDLISFEFGKEEKFDKVFITEIKTAKTKESLEKAIYEKGGVVEGLSKKLTPGTFAREINRIQNLLPIDHKDRARISKFQLVFENDKNDSIVRSAFLTVNSNIISDEHKNSIFELSHGQDNVYLYVLTCDRFNSIRKAIFEKFEVKQNGSKL